MFDITGMSFVLTLITNTIVLLGVLTLFNLLDLNNQMGKETRFLQGKRLAVAMAFDVYLIGMSILNTVISSKLYGEHWTYLNVMLVAEFVFTILLHSRWYAAWIIAVRLLYLASYWTVPTVPEIIFFALITVLQIYYSLRQPKSNSITYREWWLLVPYAFCGVGMVRLLTPGALDIWFWVRQLIALGTMALGAAVFESSVDKLRNVTFEFKREAAIDRMTGVRNFGTFNVDLQKLYDQFRAKGIRYAIYEIDIDRFKEINDTYGHPVGNTVLTRVAKEIQDAAAHLEYAANLYRMGGEEFCMILKNVVDNEQRAEEVSRELKRRINALKFMADGREFNVTVSIGQERITDEDNNYLDIYNRVDKYLYQSKESGRNAITVRGHTLAEE